MRVRFRYSYQAGEERKVVTYDEPMTCVPRAGELCNFKDRQVVIESVLWNLDPEIPCDVILTVVDPP